MERLKRYLHESGTSQARLAERMGVKQPTVWGWVHGSNLPTAENLKALAEITGISIDELLGACKAKADVA